MMRVRFNSDYQGADDWRGGHVLYFSSGGLISPTSLPSGSATIAYLAPQNANSRSKPLDKVIPPGFPAKPGLIADRVRYRLGGSPHEYRSKRYRASHCAPPRSGWRSAQSSALAAARGGPASRHAHAAIVE